MGLRPHGSKLLRFKEIIEHGVEFAHVEKLMRECFPENERRPEKAQRALLRRGDFHCLLIEKDGRPAGFLALWILPGFNFCEHLAVDPAMRGQGLGGMAVAAILAKGPLLLEVEPSESRVARMRIRFCERHSLRLWRGAPPIPPAYGPGLKPVPMLLMANFPPERAEEAIKIQKKRVYGCDGSN